MFRVIIADPEGHIAKHPVDASVELGRGPQRGDISRIVIADNLVSRDHLRIEELAQGKVRITVLSPRMGLVLDSGESLDCGTIRELTLPVCFTLGRLRVWLESDREIPADLCSASGAARRPVGVELPKALAYRTSPSRAQNVEPGSDPVDATVFAPSSVAAGETVMIQVFAHTPEQTDAAQKLAREFDDQAERRGFQSLELEIRRGSSLTFQLKLPGLSVEEPLQRLVWRGVPGAVQFAVEVPATQPPQPVIGTVTFSQQNIPLGHIKFKLAIVRGPAEQADRRPLGETACRYQQAFVSYASQDRTEVLKRVQMLSRLKISFFQDVMDLEPGERWAQALYRHINDSDVFLLFWSTAAKQSRWVMEEVRYALERKGDNELAPPEIIPIPIEGPPLVEPPAELAHLHFGDYLLYFML